MFTEKNVLYVQVGKNLAAYKAGDIDGMTDGQIAVVSVSNIVDDLGNAVTGKVKVVQKSGDTWLFSPIIDINYLANKRADVFAAATQQLSHIGYNGSGGSIDVTDNNLYSLDVEIQEDMMMLAPHPYTKFSSYVSGTSATQEQIASGLIISLINNFQREAVERIRFSRVSDSALEADVALTSAVVTHGSKQITLGATYTGLVINDFLSLDGILYKVTNIIGGVTVTLDVAYQGISETLATAVVLRSTAASVAAGDWGIEFQGLVKDNFREGVYKYQVVRFKLLTNEGNITGNNSDQTKTWGATNFTTTSEADKGTGVYETVAELEWFAQGNEGDGIRVDGYSPPRIIRKDAIKETGKGYDLITLEFHDNYTAQIGNVAVSFKQLIIATHSDATGTVHADLKTGFGIA